MTTRNSVVSLVTTTFGHSLNTVSSLHKAWMHDWTATFTISGT